MASAKQRKRAYDFRRRHLKSLGADSRENTDNAPLLAPKSATSQLLNILLSCNGMAVDMPNSKDQERIRQLNAMSLPQAGNEELLSAFHYFQFSTVSCIGRGYGSYTYQLHGVCVQDEITFFDFDCSFIVDYANMSSKRASTGVSALTATTVRFLGTLSPWISSEFTKEFLSTIPQDQFLVFLLTLKEYAAIYIERSRVYKEIIKLTGLSPRNPKSVYRHPVFQFGRHTLFWKIEPAHLKATSKLSLYLNGKFVFGFDSLVKKHGVSKAVNMLVNRHPA